MTAELSTARLLWQMGDWSALAALPVAPPGKDTATAAPWQIELALYRLQALFLTGAVDEGRALTAALRSNGVSRSALARALLSGAGSSLARARLINGQPEPARRTLTEAVALNPQAGESALVESLRFESEQRRFTIYNPAVGNSRPYVDVIGPQGSGKSTLIDTLCKWSIFSKLPKPSKYNDPSMGAHLALQFLIAYPKFAERISESLPDMHEGVTLIEFLSNVIYQYQAAPSQITKIMLFDEGFACRAISFAYASEMDDNFIRNYLQTIPLPTHLIALDLDSKNCIKRIESRPKGYSRRMQALSSTEREEVLNRMRRITDITVEEMEALGVPVINLDSRESLEENVAAVYKFYCPATP